MRDLEQAWFRTEIIWWALPNPETTMFLCHTAANAESIYCLIAPKKVIIMKMNFIDTRN